MTSVEEQKAELKSLLTDGDFIKDDESNELIFNPYNELNKEITVDNIFDLLKRYGIPAQIDNIELFPENTVQIFNRWGQEVWFGEGYDNDEVIWSGLDKNGVEMADATYFYVAVIGGQTYKGFIELTR